MSGVIEEVETIVRVGPRAIPHLREMTRQQLLGDRELMKDVLAGREDPEIRLQVADRLAYVQRLAEEIGVVEEVGESAWSRPRMLRTVLTLALVLGVTSAIAVPWALLLGATGLGSIYAPVIAWATVRYGLTSGLLSALVSAGLWESVLAPLHGQFQPLHGVVIFALAMICLAVLVRDGVTSGRLS